MDELKQRDHLEWIQKKSQVNREYFKASQQVLSNSAARGFSVPPASYISDIIQIGVGAKLKLTDLNVETYKDKVGVDSQIKEHSLKLELEYAKLELVLYEQSIMNALELELAYIQDEFKRDKADIDKIKAVIDQRNVQMIHSKAEIDKEITDYKIQMVEAEESTLELDVELLEAKLETANVRLTIIDSLREVIASEQLIVEAEKRKASALEVLVGVETEIAEIKESMIPYYRELADAKKLLAKAIEQEAKDKMEFARLQIQRAQLKITEAESFVDIKGAENRLTLARRDVDAATSMNNNYRIDSNRVLIDHQLEIKKIVTNFHEALEKAGINLGFSSQLEKSDISADGKIERDGSSLESIAEDLRVKLAAMDLITKFEHQKLIASRKKITNSKTLTWFEHLISGK